MTDLFRVWDSEFRVFRAKVTGWKVRLYGFKGLNIRIPIMIPIKGRGFLNQGSTLGFGFRAAGPATSQVRVNGSRGQPQTSKMWGLF